MNQANEEKIISLLYSGERELGIELAKSLGLYEPFIKSVFKLYKYLYANKFRGTRYYGSGGYTLYRLSDEGIQQEEGIYVGSCMDNFLVIGRKEAIVLYCANMLLKGIDLVYCEKDKTYYGTRILDYMSNSIIGKEFNRYGYFPFLDINIFEYGCGITEEIINELEELGVKINKIV